MSDTWRSLFCRTSRSSSNPGLKAQVAGTQTLACAGVSPVGTRIGPQYSDVGWCATCSGIWNILRLPALEVANTLNSTKKS